MTANNQSGSTHDGSSREGIAIGLLMLALGIPSILLLILTYHA